MSATTAQKQQPQTAHNNIDNNQHLQTPSLANYRRVMKQSSPTRDDELRITSQGKVSKYVFYADKLLREQKKETITICATGKAISVAVTVCEIVKRRFKGLHQVTTIGWTEIVDEYEPVEKGLEPKSVKRFVTSMNIVLSKNEKSVDKNAVGYQLPLDESLVEESEKPPQHAQRSPHRNVLKQQQPAQVEGNQSVATQPATRGGRRRNNRRRRSTQEQQQQQQPIPSNKVEC